MGITIIPQPLEKLDILGSATGKGLATVKLAQDLNMENRSVFWELDTQVVSITVALDIPYHLLMVPMALLFTQTLFLKIQLQQQTRGCHMQVYLMDQSEMICMGRNKLVLQCHKIIRENLFFSHRAQSNQLIIIQRQRCNYPKLYLI